MEDFPIAQIGYHQALATFAPRNAPRLWSGLPDACDGW